MYELGSDLHLHNWSAFSSINKDGVNSRLQIIISELIRAGTKASKTKHPCLMLAGDIFHVRGSIAPSVLNPVLAAFDHIVNELGVVVYAIPGNHDLESKDTTALTNGADALKTVGVNMINEPKLVVTPSGQKVVMVPWVNDLSHLKSILETLSPVAKSETDLIIHAPVDGVILGLPDHGLTPEYLGDLGFNRVFSGHYHNHVDFGNKVYSIGATTHQTWGDTHSKAGWLSVNDEVTYQASHAPSFYTLEAGTSLTEIPLLVDGNYVRVSMEIQEESQVGEMRYFLMDCGAKGVLINRLRKSSSVSRTGATVKSGSSLIESMGQFIKAKKFPRESELTKLCSDILNDAETA